VINLILANIINLIFADNLFKKKCNTCRHKLFIINLISAETLFVINLIFADKLFIINLIIADTLFVINLILGDIDYL
jgi:hypothetical protein